MACSTARHGHTPESLPASLSPGAGSAGAAALQPCSLEPDSIPSCALCLPANINMPSLVNHGVHKAAACASDCTSGKNVIAATSWTYETPAS